MSARSHHDHHHDHHDDTTHHHHRQRQQRQRRQRRRQPPPRPPPRSRQPPGTTGVVSQWTGSSATKSGSNWTATGKVTLTDQIGKPVKGAKITVKIEYLDMSGTWRPDPSRTATTPSSGSVTFKSISHPLSGSKAATAIRFTIVSVAAKGLPWNPDAYPVVLTVPAA
ncbi:MAG: hypothetical protein M5U19_01545 [Microthrixaceae bacterium]|nr:hypothetical protein [Microthrixaceae bacterium]